MAKINTLFMTKTAENHTLWSHIYLTRAYKGVPRPPLQEEIGVPTFLYGRLYLGLNVDL